METDQSKEDIFLMEILSESNNIVGFLETIFSFLHRRYINIIFSITQIL